MSAVTHKILASLSKEPGIALQSVAKISEKAYSIVCSVDSYNYSPAEIKNAVTKFFNGSFVVESNTLYAIENKHYNLFKAVVVANTVSFPFTKEVVSDLRLHLTTANVFLDEEDTIWRVVGTDDGSKRLVCTTPDNFDQILAAKKSRRPVTASLEGEHGSGFSFGDYVKFYNTEAGTVDFGYALDTKRVFVRSQQFPSAVEAVAVIDVADGRGLVTDDVNQFKVSAASVEVEMDRVLDYWKKLYSNTNFYQHLEALINQQAQG